MSRATPEFYERKTSNILRNLESIWNKLLHSKLVLSGDLSPESLQDFEDTMNSGIYSSDDYQLVGNFTRNLCRPNRDEFIEYIRKVKMQYLALLTNGSMIPRLIWFVDKQTNKRKPLHDVLSIDYDNNSAKFIVRKVAICFETFDNPDESDALNNVSETFGENYGRNKNYTRNESSNFRERPRNNRGNKRASGNEFHSNINEHKETYLQKKYNNGKSETRGRVENHEELKSSTKNRHDDSGYVTVGRNNRPIAPPKYNERRDKRFNNNRSGFNEENQNDYRSYRNSEFRHDSRDKYSKNPNNSHNEQSGYDKKGYSGKPSEFREERSSSSPAKPKVEALSLESAETIIKELSNQPADVIKQSPQSSPEKKNIAAQLGNWADYE